MDKNTYMREYRVKNADKIKKYNHEYYLKNIEYNQQYRREYYQNHKEEIKNYHHDYYKNNKDMVDTKMKEYIKKNRAKVTKMVNDRRKVVSEELKAKGMMYTFLPKTARTDANLGKIMKVYDIPREKAEEIWEFCNQDTRFIIENPDAIHDYLENGIAIEREV